MSMTLQQMETLLGDANKAIEAMTSPAATAVLAPAVQASTLLVIAECMYRLEMREAL